MQTFGNGTTNTINSVETEFPKRQYSPRPRDETRRTHRETISSKPFVAWDGEGYSDDTGEHHYMLFGGSNGDYVQGESLTWKECFPLLIASQNANNVIFGGDYDVIMMIRHMPWIVRKRLFDGEWTRYGGYVMQWRRRKYFLLKDRKLNKSVILYDVQSFFQTTFVKACREYLGESEALDAMHEMKLKRDSFTSDDETVIGYWQSELDYLVRLMDCLRELLLAVDIKPKGWYGPGAVANRVLQQHKMERFYADIPEHIRDIGERAYYGGRFEQLQIGRISNVVEYDIRSAYPFAISNLPHFGSEWEHHTNVSDTQITPFTLCYVRWHCSSGFVNMPGPLPWRDSKGRIFFPMSGSGWYWGIEVINSLAKSFPKDDWEIMECYQPIFASETRPFNWIAQMYDDRARMKREGNPAQKALKLAMNSIYGKLAQSVGARVDKEGNWKRPKWHHALCAGWVTACTRAQIYSAIRDQRQSLIAIETDAVFVDRPISGIELGDKLGQWERLEIDEMLYISSGVYYALEQGSWKPKSRGVETDKSKPVDYWLDIFSRVPQTKVEVTLSLRRFGTDIRQPKRFARWFDHQLTTVVPGGFSKRVHLASACLTCNFSDESFADNRHFLIVPQAMIDSDTAESTPYKFPWREDADYDWSEIVHSEALELPEELPLTWK